MIKLSGREPIAIGVVRDKTTLSWRARCFEPAFTVEAADNRDLIRAIEREFNAAFDKDKGLAERMGFSVTVEEDDRPGHYAVPYYTKKVA